KKITIYGCLNEKQQALDALQSLGCLHITPLIKQESLLRETDKTLQAREALRYLKSCPNKLKQIKNASSFDPVSIEQHILQNKHQVETLQDEEDVVKRKIEELTPWGNFIAPDPKVIANQKLWFYIVPHNEMKNINLHTLSGARVNKDNRFSYVVVISENEPDFMPGKRVTLPNEPLNTLKERLEKIEFKLENHQMERVQITRWLELFEKNLFK